MVGVLVICVCNGHAAQAWLLWRTSAILLAVFKFVHVHACCFCTQRCAGAPVTCTHAPIRLACPCPCRYEVLYKQLGLSRVVEMVQLGRLDPTRTITLKVGQVC